MMNRINSFLLIVVVLDQHLYFKSFVQNTGNYLSSILELSTGQESNGLTGKKVRTVFTGMVDCMVAFVGMFIARISQDVQYVSLF
jgi:choline/glycine/proline betaine transport protein